MKNTRLTQTDIKTLIQNSVQFKAAELGTNYRGAKKLFNLLQVCQDVAECCEFTIAETCRKRKYSSFNEFYTLHCRYITEHASGEFTYCIEFYEAAILPFITETLTGQKSTPVKNSIAPDQILTTAVLELADLENLKKALPFCGKDQLRQHLTGVFIGTMASRSEGYAQIERPRPQICATDCNSLFFADLSGPIHGEYILPADSVRAILKLGEPVILTFYKGENGVCFEAIGQTGSVTGQCFNETYPFYPAVIPTEFSQTIPVKNSDFARR